MLGLQALSDRWSASRIGRIHRESNELELGMHSLALAAQHVLCAAPFLVAMSAITRTLHMGDVALLLPGAVLIGLGTTVLILAVQVLAPNEITEQVADYGLVGAAFILALVLVAFSTILLWGVFLGRDLSRWGGPPVRRRALE